MTQFKPLTSSTYPSIVEPLSDAAKFWKNNVQPAIIYKELNSINSIDINPANNVLTTSASRISLYDLSNLEAKRLYSSPNHALLYCGTFRKDNSKIFAAGCGDGIIRVWDVKKNKPLRMLGSSEKSKESKHSAPVHRINFNGIDQLYSCADDKSVKLWDITEDSIVCTFGSENVAHKDYIRASCLLERTASFVSGSYDQTVKVWDQRAPTMPTFEFNHNHPVESVACRDYMMICAGGNSIKIFDIIAGKVMRTLDSVHHKTITCIYNHANYLFTASIDGYLKVYDINFNVAASFSHVPSQLLSCCYNGSALAVGSNDGILSVNKVGSGKAATNTKSKQINLFDDEDDDITDEFFFDNIPVKRKPKLQVDSAFVVKAKKHRPYLLKHDELLRKFQHSSALTRVIRVHSKTEPEVVVNVMQELIRRGALKTALAGRNDRQLKKLIQFLIENLSDARFNRILIDVSLALVEVYINQINRSDAIQILFQSLNTCVQSEIKSLQMMSEISGQLQVIINSQIK